MREAGIQGRCEAERCFSIHALEQTHRLPVGTASSYKNRLVNIGSHCVFDHRYYLVWSTKYRFKLLKGRVRLRVRYICRQVWHADEVDILRGVLSSDHVHIFVSVPPKLAISDLVRKMKGRSFHKVQREFPELRRRYLGRRFWGRGCFSTTN